MTEKLFHLGIKALIKNKKGQLLLFKEDVSNHSLPTSEYWDMAGGRVQGDETPLETLRREIKEETGIDTIEQPKFLTAVVSNHRIKLADGQIIGLILMIYKLSIPPDAPIKLSDEHLAYDWLDVTKAAKLLTHKYPKEFTDLL